MNYVPGDILKRKTPNPTVTDIGIVLDSDPEDSTIEVLQFDQDGPFTVRLNNNHADDLFELDDGQ